MPVKVAKDYSYQLTIYNECILCLETDSIPQPDVSIFHPILVFLFEHFIFSQYPIDEDLEQERKRNRKESFNKVVLNTIFILFNEISGGHGREVTEEIKNEIYAF